MVNLNRQREQFLCRQWMCLTKNQRNKLENWENPEDEDERCASLSACATGISDSQSAIGILQLGWQPTHHKQTVAEIRQKIKRLEQKDIKVDISWTPGHANIKGNEEADRLAKEASCEAAAMTSDTDEVTMTDIKQSKWDFPSGRDNGNLLKQEDLYSDTNPMLQIDLKLIFQTPFHTGTLLSSD